MTSAVQKLYENVTVSAETHQISGTGDQITLTNFHHAGTTFQVANDGTISIESLRDGYTLTKGGMTDPLNPRTDADYIFFTDTQNFANGGRVYAYYYGDTDGEYTAWPGIAAAQDSAAPTTYTDNNNNKVYMFRVPQSADGTYPKVIFTNGQTGTNIKITEASDLVGGTNYTPDAAAAATYSPFAGSGKVYPVQTSVKSDLTTKQYTVNNNRYIYIVNNGTQNLTGTTVETGANNRFILDEMHVTFYDQNKNIIGTNLAGYLPDKLGAYSGSTWTAARYNGSDVYRIQVPDNAKYFRINNGINKGLTDDSDTKKNERYSEVKEIAENGLYQFVQGSGLTASQYIRTGDTLPTDANARYQPEYLLTLLNPIVTEEEIPPIRIEDVHLATVVSDEADGANPGRIKQIKWLKPDPEDTAATPTTVDAEYLANTYPYTDDTKVKVVKKGTYYWKETTPPSGYRLNEDLFEFVYDEDGKVYVRNEQGILVEVTDATLATVTVPNEPEDEPEGGSVELTKIAKDTTTQATAGESLGAGYGFLLYHADGTLVEYIYKKTVDGSVVYYYSSTAQSGTQYNTAEGIYETGSTGGGAYIKEDRNLKALLTDADGKIRVENLPYGDYYFEEVGTPDGSLYAENFIHGWVDGNNSDYIMNGAAASANNTNYQKVHNRVFFTVSENNAGEESLKLTCEDEMAPAYLRLYEHIDEWRPDEWGSPTFIFKIRQTHTYSDTDHDPRNAVYTEISDGKEYIVALTVDDEGKMTVDNFSGDENPEGTKGNHQGIDFNNWYVETTAKDGSGKASINGGTVENNTDDDIYSTQHLFGLNSAGMLPLEPGKYTISRVNPSRYEFVTNYRSYATASNAPWAVAFYDEENELFSRSHSLYRDWYHIDENSINTSADPGKSNPIEQRDGYMLEYGTETITELELQPYRVATLHYYDRVSYYDKFSQVDTEINSFHQYENENGDLTQSVKGIRLEFRGKVQIPASGNAEVTVNTANDEAFARQDSSACLLNAYFIYLDGSERAMTAAEKANLVFSFTTQDEGETFDNDFSFDANTHKITVANPSNYKNSVYTLNAVYDGKFRTDADIVIGDVPTP